MVKAKNLSFKELSPTEFTTKFKEQFPALNQRKGKIMRLTKEKLRKL